MVTAFRFVATTKATLRVMLDRSEENLRPMLYLKYNFCCCYLSAELALSFCHTRLTIVLDQGSISPGFLSHVEGVATGSSTTTFCSAVVLYFVSVDLVLFTFILALVGSRTTVQ